MADCLLLDWEISHVRHLLENDLLYYDRRQWSYKQVDALRRKFESVWNGRSALGVVLIREGVDNC